MFILQVSTNDVALRVDKQTQVFNAKNSLISQIETIRTMQKIFEFRFVIIVQFNN